MIAFAIFFVCVLLTCFIATARATKLAPIKRRTVVLRRHPNRHAKWSCFVTQKFHEDFMLNESILKEIRLIQGMKHLVVHIPHNLALKGGLLNRDIIIQGHKIHCIDVAYDPTSRRATPYLIIDDMHEERGEHLERIDIAYRIAIAYERHSTVEL